MKNTLAVSKNNHRVELSIVIVSWKVPDLLDNCLQSICKFVSDLSYEVIVIENNSQDHTLSVLSSKYPWVKVITNSENVGFAKANNQGFEIAKGKYIFILNPDTEILDKSIQKLIALLKTRTDVGMVGPKLIYPNGEIQSVCARLLPTLKSKFFFDILRIYRIPIIGNYLTKRIYSPYAYGISQNVEAISGAAMLVRNELITQLDGFGDNFIFTGEDLDLCFRIRKAGWNIYYEHQSVIIHIIGQSRKNNPSRTAINGAISQQEYFLRNYGILQSFLFQLMMVFIEIPITIFEGIVKYIFHKETLDDFRTRIAIVKGIFLWRKIE